MRLVAYLRVSSEGQRSDGFGLAVQRKTIRTWAAQNEHRIVAWCDDVVHGGTDPVDRQGLTEALQFLRPAGPTAAGGRPRADGLVVAKLDRLARALTVQEATLAIAWRTGAKVFTAESGEVLADDPDDPMRTAMRQMMGVFAELDRRTLVKRMRDGIRAKAATGKKATGSYAYGYHADGKGRDRDAVPDTNEQAVINLIRNMRDAGTSYRRICEALNKGGYRTKRGRNWAPTTVQRIYSREMSQVSA